MFLTRAELADLTGYHLPDWQIRWLVAHGWRFERSVLDGAKATQTKAFRVAEVRD